MKLPNFLENHKVKKIIGDTLDKANETEDLEQVKRIIIKTLKEHPEMREEILSEFEKQIDGKYKNPNVLFDKLAIDITETNSIPNGIINREGFKENMTDEGLMYLIQDDKIDLDMQRTLAKKIDDPESKEEINSLIKRRQEKQRKEEQNEIINRLDNLYKKCGTITDSKVIQILNDIPEEQKSEIVKKSINAIIVRQMAYNYLRFKTIIYRKFDDILSAEEMFALKYYEKIKTEIVRIKVESKENTEKTLKELEGFTEIWRDVLLENVSREVANRYLDTGVWHIQDSEEMRNITQSEEDKMLERIEKKIRKKKGLSKEDKRRIKAQIRGNSNEDEIIDYLEEKRIFEKLNTLSEIVGYRMVKKVIDVFSTFLDNRIKRAEKNEEKKEMKNKKNISQIKSENDSTEIIEH